MNALNDYFIPEVERYLGRPLTAAERSYVLYYYTIGMQPAELAWHYQHVADAKSRGLPDAVDVE